MQLYMTRSLNEELRRKGHFFLSFCKKLVTKISLTLMRSTKLKNFTTKLNKNWTKASVKPHHSTRKSLKKNLCQNHFYLNRIKCRKILKITWRLLFQGLKLKLTLNNAKKMKLKKSLHLKLYFWLTLEMLRGVYKKNLYCDHIWTLLGAHILLLELTH